MAVRIEGVSDLLRSFDKAPNELVKDVKKAFRSACNVEKRHLRSCVPPEARSLVKSAVKGNSAGDVMARVGLFLDYKYVDTQGRKGPGWFHAYWKNYGTLQRRDPAHQFDEPIKGGEAARRRRNNVGQRHENFYESAMNGFETRFFSNFKKSFKSLGYKIDD